MSGIATGTCTCLPVKHVRLHMLPFPLPDQVRMCQPCCGNVPVFQTFRMRPCCSHPQAVHTARRLALEWQAYVVRSGSLRRVFVSVKGYYFQTEVMGQSVTWLVPHALSQVGPTAERCSKRIGNRGGGGWGFASVGKMVTASAWLVPHALSRVGWARVSGCVARGCGVAGVG